MNGVSFRVKFEFELEAGKVFCFAAGDSEKHEDFELRKMEIQELYFFKKDIHSYEEIKEVGIDCLNELQDSVLEILVEEIEKRCYEMKEVSTSLEDVTGFCERCGSECLIGDLCENCEGHGKYGYVI